MSIQIESDLAKILERIEGKIDNLQKDVGDLKVSSAKLESEIKRIEEKLTGDIRRVEEKLTGDIRRVEEKLTGDIRRVEEKLEPKIDGISKRLENQEFVSRSIVVALIVAILGGFAKLFGLIGNP